MKYLLFWTLFFKGPIRISPQNARSLKDKGGTVLHGPNTCAFVISKVQHDLMLTSKVNRYQGTIIHACESSLVLSIIKTITSVCRIKLNLQLCLSAFLFLSLVFLQVSSWENVVVFIYVCVAKENYFSRGHNKFLYMGNPKDLVSNLVKLYILQWNVLFNGKVSFFV